jgi:tRNA threonylcarbamoyl adenosine modification protein YeaZ
VSAGLVRDGVLVAERVVVDAKRHGELLAVGIREVLAHGQPDLVVVGVGPGPFTGLRVGIMTAAAFGDARGIPVLGVCSLDGLAVGASWAVTDARRKEVYFARYDDTGRRIWGPLVRKPAELQQMLADNPDEAVVGDGALLYGFATLDEPRYPRLDRLVASAMRHQDEGRPPMPLTPLYLRRPDATEPGLPKRVSPA